MRDDGQGGLKPTSQVFEEIASAFRKADYRSLPAIWTALVMFYLIKAWRWKLLLEPFGKYRTLTDLLPSVMIGFAFNNVLPAHLGEFVRMFVFSREHKLPKTGVLSSIALERIFDIVAILSFLAAGLLMVDRSDIDQSVVISAWVFAGLVCAGLAGAAVYLIWTKPFVAIVERTMESIPLFPGGFEEKVAGILEAGAEGLASLRSIRLLIGILVTSYLQWALNGLIIYMALWAFGIKVSPLVAAFVLGVVAIGVTVPSTPGYFGVIQLCFVLVLKLFVDESQTEAVFAASVYYHMAQWIPVTATGMMYFLRAGVRLADIQEEASHRNDNGNTAAANTTEAAAADTTE
jgi:uncharacterized protein (TIRG00374 family)